MLPVPCSLWPSGNLKVQCLRPDRKAAVLSVRKGSSMAWVLLTERGLLRLTDSANPLLLGSFPTSSGAGLGPAAQAHCPTDSGAGLVPVASTHFLTFAAAGLGLAARAHLEEDPTVNLVVSVAVLRAL